MNTVHAFKIRTTDLYNHPVAFCNAMSVKTCYEKWLGFVSRSAYESIYFLIVASFNIIYVNFSKVSL